MASRLDRLFMLLDNGSTPLTRKAAALQLGEVQKLHPHELNTLLVKVRQYLHSTSWDTRIAASQAVEAIISNVSLWFPSGIKDETNESLENSQTASFTSNSCRMMFERYDIRTVIRCGHNLLASEGKDFDQEDPNQQMASPLDNRENVARMRQSLNQRLGLSFAEKIGLNIDFISNSDLEPNCTVENETKKELPEAKLEDVISQATGRSLKRKPPSNQSPSDNGDHKKSKTELKEEVSEELVAIQDPSIIDSEEWPLAWFSDELMGDLFNAQWEVRHGAAIGLREIVKLQGRCGGRLKTASRTQMDRLNQQWLEDLSLRLLSVLALDKFGDYVSDQVIAPVRETCAQVLGLIIRLLTKDGVRNVLNILLQLLQCPEWEARHGGMLGLKYLLATRRDMIEQLLPEVFEPVFSGLQDHEDDVSAVAAAALVPVKDDLMRLIPEKVPLVISFLWEALLVLDDLSSSTGDLLMLLSSLLTFKGLNEDGNAALLANDQLVTLIPRLWPFLSHSLTSVRKSVLESLRILSQKSSSVWLSPELLSDALRLLYQRSLVENHYSILELIYEVWRSLISKVSYHCLIEATKNHVTGWISLMMQPQKIPIDVSNTPVWLEIKHATQNMIKTRHHQDVSHHCTSMAGSYFIGGSETLGESNEERERSAIRARYQCARLIGVLAFYLTEAPSCWTNDSQLELSAQDALDSFASILLIPLNSKSAVQRMCCAWIIREWATANIEHQNGTPAPWLKKAEIEDERPKPKIELHKGLSEKCNASLEEQIFFDEISTYVSRVQFNFRDLLQILRVNKVLFNEDGLAGKTVYTFTQINAVIEDVSAKSLVEIRKKLSEAKKPSLKMKSLLESIEEKIQSIRRSMNELNHSTTALTVAVKSSLASALISWRFLPEKLSPIIKPVMDSIKAEENEQLQQGSAISLVKLLNIFCERTYHNSMTSTPTPKIINNLITYLCSDRNHTPEVRLEPKSSAQLGILALENMQRMAERSTLLRRSNSMNMKNRTAASDDASTSNGQSLADQDKPGEVQRRGATMALSEMCRVFGSHLSEQLPSLWEYITHISSTTQLPTFDEAGLQGCRNLVQCLQVFEIIGPHVDPTLYPTFTCTYDFLCQCLQCSYIAVRHMAARCFGMLASILPNPTMNVILTKVLDMLEAADCELKRQGAVEAIYFVIDRLSLKIVPYIVLLIVPMLGRMSDQNESVRLLATHCFAQLVQLMPLDNDHHQNHKSNEKMEKDRPIANGSVTGYRQVLHSDEIELSEVLLKRKESQRRFLEQLMNIKKLDDYKLPIPVRADLRQYQQDGLNWLAFLNKYKLHGIVADEMGLGKTLQAICILASDFYHQKQRYLRRESANKPLLSLVICPPTLTGHWMYEVDKFVSAEHLCPILYTGPPIERTKIRNQIKKTLGTITHDRLKNFNLIIASYDLVRNDIDFFSSINWNYCILDEGHVIKNGKTKLAKSIKTLKANHRLILTGTPIQNNVLELWSLFDFLMPGFLGTERQFMARYSKPILASRDAKSSSKEQEAGILAMENLHRQVLPFILRRMKEDVLKDLPPKIMQDYYCELSPLQAQLYEDFYKSRARRQTLKDSFDSQVEEITSTKNCQKKSGHDLLSKSHIFQSLQYLRKVCNHPKLVLTPSHPNFAAIMEQLKNERTTLADISHAAKLGALKQLLQDCGIGVLSDSDEPTTVVNQHRALIFCQLKSMLDIVEKDLFKTHMPSVSYLRLDGDVPAASRYSVIHQFNNDPSIDVLLLTIQVGGLGLNLTGADTVIFVEHDWNPMKDLQAMDRAHRIGQKKVVNVYRLITTGTLEEKIMGLQKFKLTIANTVISSENSSLDSMATDQLLDLFELSSEKQHQNQKDGRMLTSTSSSCSSSGEPGSQVSMKMMLESLPELWDTQQYENEYDMNNFLQSLSHL